MTNHRLRSSDESEWLPYTKVGARLAMRLGIGQELRARSEVPVGLPQELLALLARLGKRLDKK